MVEDEAGQADRAMEASTACGAFAGCLHHGPLRFPWLMGLFWADLVPPFCALDLPETQMLL